VDTTPSRYARSNWIPLLVAAAVLAAYVPALRAGWIWDDDSYVTANAIVQAPDGLRQVWTLTRHPQSGAWVSNTPQYYPFVFTSFWIEHALFGLRPFVFHLTNVLLHLVNAWLLWKLLARLGMPGAGFAAALFALHPLHVESVAWVTERKNVMSGAFYLLAFLAYLRFDEVRKPRWWFLALAAFVAALLSKSVTATLPIVLGVAIWWRHRRLGAREITPLVPFLALGVASGWFTAWLEQVKVGARGAEFAHSASERWLFVAPRAWWHYVETTWFPHPLMFVYERWDPSSLDPRRWIAPIGIVALVVALFLAKRRIGWAPILLVFVSAVTLAPALGFVPVYPHRYSWVADHFAYLGSVPLVALLVLAARSVRHFVPETRRSRVALGVSVAVLGAYAVLVHREARHYHDARTLWEATIAENDTASLAQVSLGIELMRDPARTPADVARAKALFEQGARDPNLRDQAHTNLGQWHLLRGDSATAIEHYREALRADATHTRARAGLADAYALRVREQGSTADGLRTARDAQRELDGDVRFAQMEAWILAVSPDPSVRDAPRARAIAEALLARHPREPLVLETLAAACAATGDFAAAIRHQEEAVRRSPPAAREASSARLASYRRGETFSEDSAAKPR